MFVTSARYKGRKGRPLRKVLGEALSTGWKKTRRILPGGNYKRMATEGFFGYQGRRGQKERGMGGPGRGEGSGVSPEKKLILNKTGPGSRAAKGGERGGSGGGSPEPGAVNQKKTKKTKRNGRTDLPSRNEEGGGGFVGGGEDRGGRRRGRLVSSLRRERGRDRSGS